MILTTIIGIDCATQPTKTGLALGYYDGQAIHLQEVTIGSTPETLLESIVGWISPEIPTLLAIDAPLGWPRNFGDTLAAHQAGHPLMIDPDLLFRRATDRVVKELTGKQPLDVGANLIARTAHVALKLMAAISQQLQQPIPLAWEPELTAKVSAIEVYPAATLTVYGLRNSGYKGKNGPQIRQTMIPSLAQHLILPQHTRLMIEKDHALDAAICVLAGGDFLRGVALAPSEGGVVKKEGWIWVRQPKRKEV